METESVFETLVCVIYLTRLSAREGFISWFECLLFYVIQTKHVSKKKTNFRIAFLSSTVPVMSYFCTVLYLVLLHGPVDKRYVYRIPGDISAHDAFVLCKSNANDES
jgi:amino acid permease